MTTDHLAAEGRDQMRGSCAKGHPYTPENTRVFVRDGTVRRQCRECQKGYCRANRAKRTEPRPRDQEYDAAWRKKYRAEHIERVLAHDLVYRTIRRGKFAKKPCEKCGAERAEAHHEDYSKPLSVRWLCRAHHIEEHHAARALGGHAGEG